MEVPEGGDKKIEVAFGAIIAENFFKIINVRHQTRDPGNSENTK